MTAPLQLAKDAFGSHLPLEVLDGAFDALVADDDFDGLTLHCITDDDRHQFDLPLTKARQYATRFRGLQPGRAAWPTVHCSSGGTGRSRGVRRWRSSASHRSWGTGESSRRTARSRASSRSSSRSTVGT